MKKFNYNLVTQLCFVFAINFCLLGECSCYCFQLPIDSNRFNLRLVYRNFQGNKLTKNKPSIDNIAVK